MRQHENKNKFFLVSPKIGRIRWVRIDTWYIASEWKFYRLGWISVLTGGGGETPNNQVRGWGWGSLLIPEASSRSTMVLPTRGDR